MHPPLPSSNNSSTARRMRAYSFSRHGRRWASGREATCRTCMARNHGSSGRFSTSKSGVASGGGGRMAIVRLRVARARNAAFECGVGAATFVPPVRFPRGVSTTPRLRWEGVRGRKASSSSLRESMLASSSEPVCLSTAAWRYSSLPPSLSPSSSVGDELWVRQGGAC